VARSSFAALVGLLLLVLPRAVLAQVPDSTLPPPPARFDIPMPELQQPAALRAPWLGGHEGLVSFDSAVSAALDSAHMARSVARRALSIYGRSAVDTTRAPEQRRGPLGLDEKYADLAIDGQATLDIRTERVKNERCTAAELNDPTAGCGGRIKAPQLENNIDVRSSGLIGRRVHVNVDYQSARDFTANNNIQVYYQGLTDEIVQRVEVGTVTFRPPPSRFLTAAVPRSNFGVNGLFEVGPMEFQALFATQKGSSLNERVFQMGSGTTAAPQDRQIRDLDFESGRFYWVVDPTRIAGYPALDILNLDPGSLPQSARPAQVRVYRYRAATAGNNVTPTLGGVKAFASNSADPTQRLGQVSPDEGVQWELLLQGRDYYLDPSGLWFALAIKLDPTDYLAVSYTTESGGRVGTFPSVDQPATVDSLELIVEPRRGPEAGTFRHEMRQIYRVAGSDLDRTSLKVAVTLNQTERPQGSAPTYLAQLGLALPADPASFDAANRLFPRARDSISTAGVLRESYIIFPNLTPFADPARLTAAEITDSLYRTPAYLMLSPQGPPSRFQFRLRYNAASGGDRSQISLNALQLKEESEQIEVNGRQLTRGVDYTIDYSTGVVTFIDPDALFGSSNATVTARFEQQDLFAIAPTSIVGLTSRYSLGEVGAINLIGVFQREASAFNRPQLGFEAKANMVGGVSTDLHFRSDAITRFMNGLSNTPSTAPSRLDLNGELAFSKPDPNRSGAAYLEEFERDVGTPISLFEQVWEFSSAPQQMDGVDPLLGFGGVFDPADATQLTWQNLVPNDAGHASRWRPQDIDSTIVLAGKGDQFETVLWLGLQADTAGGFPRSDGTLRWTLEPRPLRPRWRSIVTPLSSTGVDLSRSEYLEFYVYESGAHSADSAHMQVLIDLGSVSEEAVAFAPERLTTTSGDTLYDGRQQVGVGRLDTERGADGIFNAATDDIGILGDRPDSINVDGTWVPGLQLCHRELRSTVQLFPWGDLGVRCTSGNGHLDTEDLNGDNLLNARGANESVFRMVVDLRDSTYIVKGRGQKYFDRDGQGGWTLYRVPLHGPNALEIGAPNIRLIQQLRLTFVAPPAAEGPDLTGRLALARMRFVGAPWNRRAETPIAGLSGSTGLPHGDVVAATVSTENVELGYTPPPGAANSLNDKNVGSGQLTQQINEKSLRVIATDLALNERAEAYVRFASGSQNLLNYSELRVWVRGHGEGWERGDLEAFVKLGSDDRNFYLYHAPASTTSWEPEMIIDLEVWRTLRADIEARWLRGEAPSGAAECGGDPLAYVACQDGYMVQVGSPGINPPNLASIQELSAGVYRVADHGPLPTAEVWIDDIRVTEPVSKVGKAYALDARLSASDVGDLSVSLIGQDGQFRQIGQAPTFRSTSTLRLGGNVRLDRFLPASLGLAMPASVSLTRASIDPQLIGGTDIRGAALEGLRRPRSWAASYSFSLRRSARGQDWLMRGLVDPLTVSASFASGLSQSELSHAENSNTNLLLSYNLPLGRSGPVVDLSGILPGFLRSSEAGKALAKSRFSLAPSNIRFSTGLVRDRNEMTAYQVPIIRDLDTTLVPTLSLNHVWRNNAGLTWRPLGMLTLSADVSSSRDLRHYPDSTESGRLATLSRRSFLGMDVGVERDRQIGTSATLTPVISSWLRPRFIHRSGFTLSRFLTSRPPIQAGGDTVGAFVLPQTLNNSRSNEIGTSVDIGRLVGGLAGDSSTFNKLFARVRPLDLSSRRVLSSSFDLAAFEPTLSYQLGFGDLNDFLQQFGTKAIAASDLTVRTLTSGADLPLGVSFALSYSQTDVTRYQRITGATQPLVSRQTEWPAGNVRWSQTFTSGPLTLLALGTTFRHRAGLSEQPAANQATARNSTTSTSFSPDLQLGLRNGMSLSASLSSVSQRDERNGTSTLLDQNNILATLSYSFRLPETFSRSRKRVNSSLQARTDHSTTCLISQDEEDCVQVSDTKNQAISANFSTDLGNLLTGAFEFGYLLNAAEHLNRRLSTIYMTISFRLALYAGDLR
jgi:hypothetical protein